MIVVAWLVAFLGLRPAAAGLRYNVTALQTIQTNTLAYATPMAINDSGVAVGTDMAPGSGGATTSHQTAVRWTASGAVEALALPSSYRSSAARDINNSGVIAGYFSDFSNNSQPARWLENGTSKVLQALPTQGFSPFNDVSTILSNGRMYGKSQGRPVEFTENGAPVLLTTSGSQSSSPLANNTGRVISERLESGWQTFQYSPIAKNLGFFVQGRGMNDRGEIVGNQYVSPENVLSPWSLYLGTGMAINDRGDIVGNYRPDAAAGNYKQWAFERINGVDVDLTSRVANDPRWELEQVYDINNRGQIVGVARFDDDNNPATPILRMPFRLDPVRTPGDTNYDDAVDFADLVTLAQNYGKSGNGTVFWETGDFDFDWTVGFSDLVTLAQNYDSAGTFAADWALAQSRVPEPTTMTLTFVGTLLLARRRPRCRPGLDQGWTSRVPHFWYCRRSLRRRSPITLRSRTGSRLQLCRLRFNFRAPVDKSSSHLAKVLDDR